jgi:hypothetical protein
LLVKPFLFFEFIINYFIYFSDANSSSRSKSSKLGLGNSLKIGGKVAGCNPSIGVSNYGGINVKISCFTLNFLYNETASGIKSVVNLNRFSSKS